MPVTLPHSVKQLLQDKAYGHVVTFNAQGKPQLTMVWMDVDGDEVTFNTAEGRNKPQNLRRDPRIIVSVQDRNYPQTYAVFHGKARITETGADDHVDKLARRFLNVREVSVPSARREATDRTHQRRSDRRLRSEDATLGIGRCEVSPQRSAPGWALPGVRRVGILPCCRTGCPDVKERDGTGPAIFPRTSAMASRMRAAAFALGSAAPSFGSRVPAYRKGGES